MESGNVHIICGELLGVVGEHENLGVCHDEILNSVMLFASAMMQAHKVKEFKSPMGKLSLVNKDFDKNAEQEK